MPEMSENDRRILSKVSNSQPLKPNEAFRYEQLSKTQGEISSNIKAFEKGNRRSPL